MNTLNLITPLLSQAAGATTGSSTGTGVSDGLLSTILMIGCFVFFMWFCMIRPQQNERKKHDAMLESLKVGDKVVTIGGLCGSITNIIKEKDTVQLLIDDKNNVKVTFLLTAIAYPVTENEDKK